MHPDSRNSHADTVLNGWNMSAYVYFWGCERPVMTPSNCTNRCSPAHLMISDADFIWNLPTRNTQQWRKPSLSLSCAGHYINQANVTPVLRFWYILLLLRPGSLLSRQCMAVLNSLLRLLSLDNGWGQVSLSQKSKTQIRSWIGS